MIRRVLVPVDFSKPSLAALEYAIDLTRSFGPELVVLHAVEPMSYAAPPGELLGGAVNLATIAEEQTRIARGELARLRDGLAKKGVCRSRALLVSGSPVATILETARKTRPDLLVLGTHGRGALAHLLMGSVAERVVRQAPCPVLTVGPRGARKVARAARSRKAGKGRRSR